MIHIQKQTWENMTLYLMTTDGGSVQLEIYDKPCDDGVQAYICKLWVEDEYRRKGIATALLNTAEELARRENMTAVYLDWNGRVKQGILLGRPPMTQLAEPITDLSEKKEQVIEQFKWGVPERRLAVNFGVDRNTIARWLHRWGVKHSKYIEKLDKEQNTKPTTYKDGDFEIAENIDKNKLRQLIECDLTIPQIAEQFAEYTYDQIYDTVYCDRELNPLYRKHGQLKIKKKK